MRRRAALAAGRIGDRALVPPLVELLDDPEVEVRRMAAFALGLVGDAAAVERLLSALADPDGTVRGRAAEALGRIGEPRAAAAVARLVVDALPKTISRMAVRGDDPGNPGDGWSEQRLALVALAAAEGSRRGALGAARRRPTALRLVGWRPGWRCGSRTPRCGRCSWRPLASDDPRSRALAARGLGVLKDASAVELLLPLVRDADESVALQALRALGAIADAARHCGRGGAARLAQRRPAARGAARSRRAACRSRRCGPGSSRW